MTEHAMPDAAPNTAHLFEIVRTTRSMRRLKPDPVPNELIRKILEAGVCAPSGGNMQRWRFLVIRDLKSRRRSGACTSEPGMSRLHHGIGLANLPLV
jgi:hypothetical protein